MPAGGAPVHGEMQATVRRLAHEKFTAAEVGDLLGRAAHEAARCGSRRPRRAPAGRDGPRLPESHAGAGLVRGRARAGHLGRAARVGRRAPGQQLRRLPAAPREGHRPQAAVRRLLSRQRPPLRRAARRLRAGHDHRRRESRLRRRASAPDCPAEGHRRPARRGRQHASPTLAGSGPAAALGGRGLGVRVRLDARPAGQVHPPVCHRDRVRRRAHHHAVRGSLPVLAAVRHAARDRARALRAGRRPRAPSHAARGRRLARRPRVAEPAVGEPGGPVAPVLGALLSGGCRRGFRTSSAASASTSSTGRSTRCSRRSSAWRPTRPPTTCTS